MDGGSARRGKGSGGGCKGFGSGGVSGRGTDPRDGANFATCVVFLLLVTRTKRRKMAFFEGCPVGWGGGTHRSWPGGRGVDQAAELGGRGVREEGQGVGGGVQGLRHRSWPGGRGGRRCRRGLGGA